MRLTHPPFSVSDQTFSANLSSYSHYVFSAMDLQETGVITFEVLMTTLLLLLMKQQGCGLRSDGI